MKINIPIGRIHRSPKMSSGDMISVGVNPWFRECDPNTMVLIEEHLVLKYNLLSSEEPQPKQEKDLVFVASQFKIKKEDQDFIVTLGDKYSTEIKMAKAKELANFILNNL